MCVILDISSKGRYMISNNEEITNNQNPEGSFEMSSQTHDNEISTNSSGKNNQQQNKTMLEKVNAKELGVILGLVIVIGICVAIIIVINNNNGQDDNSDLSQTVEDERAEAMDEILESVKDLKEEQIASAKEEADATDNIEEKANAFTKRINDMYEKEELDVAGALLAAGESYFEEMNEPAGILDIYTGIDYDAMMADTYVYLYYQKIMDLAEETGNDKVKAEWQSRYDEAKAVFDEYMSASGGEENDDVEEE